MSSLPTLLTGPLLLTLVTAAGTKSPSYPEYPYPITDLVSFIGACPEIDPVGNFCYKNMEENWFEHASYRDSEHIFKCNEFIFRFDYVNGKMAGGRRREKLWEEKNKRDITTLITSLDNTAEGIFNLSTIYPNQHLKVELKIIYMDQHLLILWGCRANPTNKLTNQQSLLVLTREPLPDNDVKSTIDGTVSSLGLDMKKLKMINQADCGHDKNYTWPQQVC